jgi:hypothetical protein
VLRREGKRGSVPACAAIRRGPSSSFPMPSASAAAIRTISILSTHCLFAFRLLRRKGSSQGLLLSERERDKKREKELRSKLKWTWKICFKSFSALEKKILFCVESSPSNSAFFFPLSNQPPFFSCLSFLSHVLSPHRFEGFGETAAAAKALATASRPFKGGGAGR